MNRILLFFCTLLFFSSCARQGNSSNHISRKDSLSDCAKSVPLKYAKNFAFDETQDGYRLHLIHRDSSQSDTTTFFLIRGLLLDSANTPHTLSIPLRKIASLSGTHLEFLQLLESFSSLTFTCDSDFIYSPDARKLIRDGKIATLGNSMQINCEKLLMNKPDLLLLSDERERPSIDICPTLVCQEWKEEDVLARAEWIKFFALLTDHYSLAEVLFDSIESNYLRLKDLASTAQECPTLFSASCFGDTWYMTGGKGYMAQLYRDAHTNFLLSDTLVGTVVCDLEWMMNHTQEADYWLNCQTFHAEELDSRLSSLPSVQRHKVYHFNKRAIDGQGIAISDFFESAVAHPDILLKDVVFLLHPSLSEDSLLSQYSTTYIDSVRFQ